MNPTLCAWNDAPLDEAKAALISCCAATRWAEALTTARPFANEDALFRAADEVWATMREPDWRQAFSAHPRIGERKAENASVQSKAWSAQEQASVQSAQAATLEQLAAENARYEELFGFTYIVCATGKSADEMLTILNRRLTCDRQTELREAAEQQRQITQVRLRKWLQSSNAGANT